MELWSNVEQFRGFAHHYNDKADEWFGKVQEARGNKDHMPAVMSNITGFTLAQDKIIYLWYVQKSEQLSWQLELPERKKDRNS